MFDQADPKWARCVIKSFGNPGMKLKHVIMAQNNFEHKWMLMNIANNRKAITKVGTTLDTSSWCAKMRTLDY